MRATRVAITMLTAAGTLAATLAATAGPATASTGTPACTTASLSASVVPGEPGAGQRYAMLKLTNTGSRSCTVRGYGGLALLGAPGQGVPTAITRASSPAATTLTLAPRYSATSLLHWTAVPADNEPGTACEPTPVTVVITPPGSRTAFLEPWKSGPVCQHGAITQSAYVAR